MSALKIKRDEKKGKIWSHVRSKWLVETPEETVRQEYLLVLVNEYGFALDQIAEEMDLTGRGSASARAKQAFATGGVADASVQVLEGLNHYMQRAVSGSTDEYADPNRTPFDKASTDAILAWLDAHFPSK